MNSTTQRYSARTSYQSVVQRGRNRRRSNFKQARTHTRGQLILLSAFTTRSPCRIAMTAFSNANVTAARWIRKRQVKLNLGVLQTLFPLNNLVNFGQVVWITHALDSLRTRILFAQSHLEFLDKSPYLHRGKFTKLQWCAARLLEHL